MISIARATSRKNVDARSEKERLGKFSLKLLSTVRAYLPLYLNRLCASWTVSSKDRL